MLTKYILHIDGEDYTLRDDDLCNWSDVKCSHVRSDYGGVMRSFTSQFEFVNHARRLLLDLYLSDRFNSEASVSVHTQTNSWTFEKRFECHLDFSTVKWDDHIFSINAVDNSIAALIKANKSTKYEYSVGTDIHTDGNVYFDRIPMVESATYEFTQGTTYDDKADIKVRFTQGTRPWVGNVGSELAINKTVYFTDDQEDNDNGFLLRAENDVVVTFDYDLEWRTNELIVGDTMLGLRIVRNGQMLSISDTESGDFCKLANVSRNKLPGSFSSASQLPDAGGCGEGTYAVVSGIVYYVRYRGFYEWTSSGKSEADYFLDSKKGSLTVSLNAGDLLVMIHTETQNSYGHLDIMIVKSLFTFRWNGIGDPVSIPALKPATVASRLLESVTGRDNIRVEISKHDSRIASTFLMAAESIRGIAGARLYTSFNEFCDWMSAVFGYVYTICEGERTGFKMVRECGGYSFTPYSFIESHVGRSVTTDDIWYFPVHGRFLARNPSNGNYYTLWEGHGDYNGPDGYARTDVLFRIKAYDEDELCYFEPYDGKTLFPIASGLSEDAPWIEYDVVRFLHRSELFAPAASVRRIAECTDVEYSVDTSVIYSTVKAGYERKDYNSINGRDEFNFNNTYTTGCKVGDKTLTLMSKYRADSYGVEFAVQKRGEDTTDSTSDQDVFFVLCARSGGRIVPDRSIAVSGTLSGKLFNAAFSPLACVRANAGLIGLQAGDLTLAFTSSDGNSDISIAGEPLSSDITINEPFATCGVLEFSIDEVIDDSDEGALIEVASGGITYRGFIKEADTCYARAETTGCKMIVKEVVPWS